MSEEYIIIKDNGLERFALPKANRSVRHSAVNIHKEGTTLKSYLAHHMLLLNAWVGPLAWLPGTHLGLPERLYGFNLKGWLEQTGRTLCQKQLYVSIAFPPKTQEKRFIAYLVNETGRSVGFAKVSRDDFTDNQIRAEIDGLKEMAKLKASSFSIPNILDFGIYDEHQYLILDVIPESNHSRISDTALYLEQILHELAGCFAQKVSANCSWWKRLEIADESVQSLVEVANERQSWTIPVTISHGDFGVGNTYQCKNNIYLYDWEEFCVDAPRFTDWLLYLLPPTQIKTYLLDDATKSYNAAYERIRLIYPEVTHWDLGLALLLLATRRNWVVSPETTKFFSDIIYHRC